MTTWEAIAMFLAVAYLLLAIKQSLWCWVAAFVSTLIYSIIFFDVSLLMDSALNVYYLIMAIYGWYSWKYGGKLQEVELKISSYGISKNIKIIIVLGVISISLGYIMDNYTSADFAYIDSFTTVYAIFSTYMLAKKIIENWIYWIAIDAVSIYIYIQKGLNLTAVLFLIYTILAFVAYKNWKKEYEYSRV
ncbi:nicotinamide riboside transporter PnuC [Halarcobacter sp.]|uniref:nicotinamide riboside transporter PnuC n=1 Tax=Halarcobacter sp. TaxID=2321133 RepID=UPI002AA7B869|nr:nicotinamide riboside transporter PnuC [Halarcobacter sp.]